MNRSTELDVPNNHWRSLNLKHWYRLNRINILFYGVVILLGLSSFWLFPNNSLVAFWISAFAIVFLAYILGTSVENIAERTTATIGALMAASLSNGTEIIIGYFAIKQGEMELLKASITGSIIGQLLFVSGMAIFFGGLKYQVQHFNKINVQALTTLLLLCMFAFLLPTYIHSFDPELADWLSLPIGLVLFVLYLAFLLFSIGTHRELVRFDGDEAHVDAPAERTGIVSAIGWLVLSGLTIAYFAHQLVSEVEQATQTMGLNRTFVGIFIVAIAGNVAENSSAVWFAMKNKLDLALNVTLGSSLQIALLVVPVFLVMSALAGVPFNLVFSHLEMVAIAFGTVVMLVITNDGETNWLEGLSLLALYLLLGICFFHWRF